MGEAHPNEWNKGLKIAQDAACRRSRGWCQMFDLCLIQQLWQVPSDTQRGFLNIQHPLEKLLLPPSPSGVELGTQIGKHLFFVKTFVQEGFVMFLFMRVNGIQGEKKQQQEQLEFLEGIRAPGQTEKWKSHLG